MYINIQTIVLLYLISCSQVYADIQLDKIRLPPGFSISLFAEDVPNARSMTLGAKGTLFVGTRSAGRVYALEDKDKDGKAEEIRIYRDPTRKFDFKWHNSIQRYLLDEKDWEHAEVDE